MNITYGNVTFNKEYFESEAYLNMTSPIAARKKALRMEQVYNFSLALNNSNEIHDLEYKNFHQFGFPADPAAIKFIKDNTKICLGVEAFFVLIIIFLIMGIIGKLVDLVENPE